LEKETDINQLFSTEIIIMKLYALAASLVILLSSCLKESIPDAMLNKKNGPKVTATFSYKLNGNAVSRTIEDVRNQSLVPYPTMGCSKQAGRYDLLALLDPGVVSIYLFTDTLAVGNYTYTTADVGELDILDYFNQTEFLHAPTDRISVNVSSHANGYISGTFSAVLTPMVDGSTTPYIFGTPSSILVTEGSFKNIPVFY
jgi:hypothetical protein